MSITDELRKWWVRKFPVMDKELHKDFIAIADRIDAAVDGMIELPKDADDVPWSVGDRDEDGNVVIELRRTSSGWFVVTDDMGPYRPERKRHHHAPTVEDVLREFARVGIHIAAKHGIKAGEFDFYADEEAIAEYAAKLREVMAE